MSKAQTGFNGTLKPVAVEKRTRQGNGRGAGRATGVSCPVGRANEWTPLKSSCGMP